MLNESFRKLMLYCFLLSHIHASGYTGKTQDQTSPRVNTLSDDADDIQRQLDNEAKDRIKYGRPKTVWVFHFPSHVSDPMEVSTEYRTRSLLDIAILKGSSSNIDEIAPSLTDPPPMSEDWDYALQNKWYATYPECGGHSQSPVDLPVDGLVKAKRSRKLSFANYNVMPHALTLVNDGNRVILFGKWPKKHQPLIYGGAAHSRRYVFHSLTLHWPSEHTVGGLMYPMESQAIHISAEYKSFNEALQASTSDPQAFLAIANMYKFSNETQSGLADLLGHAINMGIHNKSIENRPLGYFNPPFKEYACYHGSLPTPPCTESVLWFVRGKTLSVVRIKNNGLEIKQGLSRKMLLNWCTFDAHYASKEELVEASQGILVSKGGPHKLSTRQPQPLNDRRVFLFS